MPETLRRGIPYCCINFGYRERLDKTAGSIKIFHRKNLSHSAEYFRRGILYCCLNFGYRESLDKREGEIDIPSKIFCLTLPEKFRRVILYCCINVGYRKKLDKRGGEYPDFPSKTFCLTMPKTSVRESFVALISGTDEFGEEGGGIKIFRRKVFVSQCRKFP